ncbi:putative Ig domain-containing protein [Alicyclobacillus sp. SO9]|nr:putative Ig domain-containing protein [Alicyclobacillus sp. SO9]
MGKRQGKRREIPSKRKRLRKSLTAFIVVTPLSLMQMQNTHVLAATTGSWVNITNGGSFDVPWGIAEDSTGDLFVANFYNGKILERKSGSTTWTTIPNGVVTSPAGMAIDSAGDVFITQQSDNTILERKSGSTKWINITDGGTFSSPTGIAVDSTGDLFVTNYNNSRVMERKSGTSTWVTLPNGGAFYSPFKIAVDTAGDLFVTNQGTGLGSVLELKSGSTTWTPLPNDTTVNWAAGVAVDNKGDVFVAADKYIFALKHGSSQWDISSGPFVKPTAIAVDSANNLFVTDQNQNKIYQETSAILPSVPAQPTHSSITQSGWTESWSAVSGATSYNVYVNGTKVNSSPVTGTSYDVSGQKPDTMYRVTIEAVNGAWVSPQSTADRVTTLSSTPSVPGAPTGIYHSNVTESGWTESWSAASGAASYNVYVNGTKVNSSPVTGTSYDVSGEQAGTSYKVTVAAVNAGGQSAQSTTDTVGTIGALSVSTGPSLSSVLQGAEYSQVIQATGGLSPYTFAVTSGSLPKGLTLESNGHLVGKPLTNGSYDFTVQVTDKEGNTATEKMSLYVIPAAPAGILPTVDTIQVVGNHGGVLTTNSGSTKATLVVAGGTFANPLQMDVTSGSIPGGLIPNHQKFITAYGVNFDAQADAPSKPMTFTILNSGITPQSTVYKILNGKLVPVSAVVTQGKAVMTFTTDPAFVVMQPQSKAVAVPEATKPVTGFGARPWGMGGLLSILTGGILLWWQRKKHREESHLGSHCE